MSDYPPENNGGVIGTLSSVEGQGVVRIEEHFSTSLDEVWSAFTDPRRLALWLGEVEGDLRLGGEFRARFSATGWEGTGRIEACEPLRRLAVRSWDEDGENVVEVTLTAEGPRTSLILEERGIPIDLLAAFGAGVQIHVEDLAAHLGGHERRDARTRWQQLEPLYRKISPTAG